MENMTAHEINEMFGVNNQNVDVIIDGQIQNTMVYTHDDINKIIKELKGYEEDISQNHTELCEKLHKNMDNIPKSVQEVIWDTLYSRFSP